MIFKFDRFESWIGIEVEMNGLVWMDSRPQCSHFSELGLLLSSGFSVQDHISDESCHDRVQHEQSNLEVKVIIGQIEVFHDQRRILVIHVFHELIEARKHTAFFVVAKKGGVLAHTVHHLLDVVTQQPSHFLHVERFGPFTSIIAVQNDQR